jgi:Kef-type K+ transport system membrane component KefB
VAHDFSLLLALATVIVAARAVGALVQRFHQPAVIGEVLAGILLGPSVLGRFAPSVASFLIPARVMPVLGAIAQLGVVLFVFLVGLEIEPREMRAHSGRSVTISLAGIAVPFVFGAALAAWLYPRVSSPATPLLHFAPFMGVSLAVTAFPVLARILTDRRMHRSRMGVLALTCAAIQDVVAWCVLAFVVSLVGAGGARGVHTVLYVVVYGTVMLVVGRPLVARLVAWRAHSSSLSPSMLAAVISGLLLSALATEASGVHALFGAFLFGVLIPRDSLLAQDLLGALEHLVVVLFLPVFFAAVGAKTRIDLVAGGEQWLLCATITLVACLGKLGGTFIAARATGLRSRDAAVLGALMNTRGLMELVVLQIGLDLGIVSPALFTMMVIMALVTTMMTTPILHVLTRDNQEYVAVWDGTLPDQPARDS